MLSDLKRPLQGGRFLEGSFEIWRRAIHLVLDFPLSGAGISTFVPVVNVLYPYFTIGEPNIPHALNHALVLANDLGLPGLVLYAALLGVSPPWCPTPGTMPGGCSKSC